MFRISLRQGRASLLEDRDREYMAAIGRFYRGLNPKIGGDLASMVVKKAEAAAMAGWNWKNPLAATATCRQYMTETSTNTTTAASSLKELLSASAMPLLMIPPEVKWTMLGDESVKDRDKDKDFYHFYNYQRDVVAKARKRPIPGLPDDAPWIGSCHGWVIFMNPTNLSDLYLVNPLIPDDVDDDQGEQRPYYVPLPPLDHQHGEIYIEKLAMSAAPYDDHCKILAVIGPSGDLAFCKPRENNAKWTPLKGLLKAQSYSKSYHYSDVIYSSQNQLFYAIGGELNDHYYFDAWDLNGARPQGTLIRPSLVDPYFDCDEFGRGIKSGFVEEEMIERRYLVELAGDLFLCQRFIQRFIHKGFDDDEKEEFGDGNSPYKTHLVMHFELDGVQNKWNYRSYDTIGDHAVFLGLNHSLSRSTLDCPEVHKGDVYYTDDPCKKMKTSSDLWGGHDCSILGYNRCFFPHSLRRIQPPPIWVNNVPSL